MPTYRPTRKKLRRNGGESSKGSWAVNERSSDTLARNDRDGSDEVRSSHLFRTTRRPTLDGMARRFPALGWSFAPRVRLADSMPSHWCRRLCFSACRTIQLRRKLAGAASAPYTPGDEHFPIGKQRCTVIRACHV